MSTTRKRQQSQAPSTSPTATPIPSTSDTSPLERNAASSTAFRIRPDLTTAWIDGSRFIVRADVKAIVLSFFQSPPGIEQQQFELFRGIASTEHFKQIIDAMCRAADYYPSRESSAHH